jgi:hypothetical protein
VVSSFNTGFATTHLSVTSSAAVSGNRFAVWPSSPNPSRIRSRLRGSPIRKLPSKQGRLQVSERVIRRFAYKPTAVATATPIRTSCPATGTRAASQCITNQSETSAFSLIVPSKIKGAATPRTSPYVP